MRRSSTINKTRLLECVRRNRAALGQSLREVESLDCSHKHRLQSIVGASIVAELTQAQHTIEKANRWINAIKRGV